jgi:hypothetical protein
MVIGRFEERLAQLEDEILPVHQSTHSLRVAQSSTQRQKGT